MTVELLKLKDGRMRIDLDRCYGPFLGKALKVLAACRERGQDYYPTFGYRSWAQQHQLRQAFLTGKGGKAAPAGESAHNYGLAWDVCADSDQTKPGLQPNWSTDRYKILGEETKKAGLVWGGSFNDSPHIQWPGYVNGAQLRTLQKVWKTCPQEASDLQRLCAVWQYIEVLDTSGSAWV